MDVESVVAIENRLIPRIYIGLCITASNERCSTIRQPIMDQSVHYGKRTAEHGYQQSLIMFTSATFAGPGKEGNHKTIILC